MTKKHSAKRAFISSFMSFVMCFVMLAGTTFAWYTDSVTSSGNRIMSGTLDVDLLMYKYDEQSDQTKYVSIAGGEGDIFREAAVAQDSSATLWEPGKTQVVYLAVKNNGNLALRYNILLDVRDVNVNDTVNLADVLDFSVVDGATNATQFSNWNAVLSASTTPAGTIGEAMRAASGEAVTPSFARITAAPYGKINPVGYTDGEDGTDYFALAVHMQEEAGNEYMGTSIIIDVTIIATQATVEYDSFDNMYDAQAGFPPVAYAMNTNAGENFNVDAAGETVIRDALAVSTVPADTSVKLADDTEYTSDSSGVLNREIKSESHINSVSYDISYSYTTTTTDGQTGETTSETKDVTEFSNIVVNELNIGKDLKIISVTHSHEGSDPVEMSMLSSADENAVGYYYDHENGILTIKSDKYSIFDIQFDSKIAVESLAVEVADSTIDVGASTNVTGTVLPDEATYKTITWSSSDPSVISVDQNGAVTAHKAGVVTITATADGVIGTCTVTAVADAVIYATDTYYLHLQDALDAADGKTVTLLRNVSDPATVTGVNNVTLDMDGFTLTQTSTGTGAYALRLYDCDTVTVKDGTINGQIRVGEHKSTNVKWKHLNYGDDNYEAVSGYHPLVPAKNVVLENLTVASGNIPALYFTNIEDDLTRGAPSNYCDNNLYGRYIYKTGYVDKDQYINSRYDEVFTVCTDKDSVTILGGTYSSNNTITGHMNKYDENGKDRMSDEIHSDVLTVKGGTFSNDTIGRFVEEGKYLVGSSGNSFEISAAEPETFTAKTGKVIYTYAGGADDAIRFANIGETVYIVENASAAKEIAQDESFTVVSLTDGVSWTGATVTRSVENPENFEILVTPDPDNPLKKVYTVQSAVTARLYHLGDTRQTPTASTPYDEYYSFVAAVNAAGTGDYVMLMKDTTISDEGSISSSYDKYGINLSARMVLDLNGHTYTYTGSGTAIICTANTGTDGGQRAIRDSSADKTGTVYATNGYAFEKYNKNTEKTVIYGGNFVSATTNAVYVRNANVFEIQGGRFITLKNSAPVSGTVTTRTGGTDIQTTVSSEQYLVINSDNTFEVRDLENSGNDYILTAPAGKTVLLPAKTKVGYIFGGWSTTDSSFTGKNGMLINSSDEDVQFHTEWTEITEFKINLSETEATVTVTVNGEEWDRISKVKPGDKIKVSVVYKQSNSKSCTIKDQNGTAYSLDTEFDMPRANLTITASSSSSCFAAGTLITLADGSQKAIEDVAFSDRLLAWDFFNGTYSNQGVAILVNHGSELYTVANLEFSDGTVLRIIGDHGVFDYDANAFVYITADNYADYIGRKFVQYDPDGLVKLVTLVSATVTEEYTAAYSITSAGAFNVFASGLLTVAPPADFYNWIAMGGRLRYDAAQFEADVETYGLYDYGVFADYVTYDQFVAFNGAYLKIPVEKGVFSFSDVIDLIELYGEFMPK